MYIPMSELSKDNVKMRKLASIQKISSTSPIPGADNIIKATVLGWEVVCNINDFKPGDLVVYCEIDSILPERPAFEFLRNRNFRIKTAKFKGQISQGICFTLDILPPGRDYKLGDDVTDLLGVKKYDPQTEAELKALEQNLNVKSKRIVRFLNQYSWFRKMYLKYFVRKERETFPTIIPKTDEPRIQILSEQYDKLFGISYNVTEKLDGQSATYFLFSKKRKFLPGRKIEYGVCSRNYHLIKEDDSTWHQISRKLKIEKVLKNLLYELNTDDDNAVIYLQGEIIGPNIQNNIYNLNELDFYAFNLVVDFLDIQQKINFNINEMKYFLEPYAIKTVPHLKTDFFSNKTIPELVEMSKGYSILNDKKHTKNKPIIREGLVFKNSKHHFKVINPDYLLKQN